MNIKNISLALLLVVSSIYLEVNGQRRKTPSKEKKEIGLFSFGALAGPAFSQIDGDGYQGFDKLGYFVAIKGEAKLTDRFFLEVNLAYSRLGAKFPSASLQSANEDRDRIIDMKFAEVPFLINYVVPKKKFDLILEFGGGLSQLLDYTVKEDLRSSTIKPFGTLEDDLRRRGANIIGGVEWKIKNLSLGTRLTSSLTYQYYNDRYFELASQGLSDSKLVPLMRSYYLNIYAGYTLLSVAK
jgi:hypothetical protein